MAFNDDLSSALGYASIAAWIIVYSPQIYENFALQSGEGLSLAFVIVWLIGDVCNLVGAVIGGLLPTIIILAAYYTVCDLILLFQIFYYRDAARKTAASLQVGPEFPPGEPGEETPLLDADFTRHTPKTTSPYLASLKYVAGFVFVFGSGLVAFVASNHTSKAPTGIPPPPVALQTYVQVIGWTSAVAYLGARIPQIVKNFETRCEGLSPALFCFSIGGNVTYTLSILVKSMDHDYLVRNGAWLAGSGLTVFLDFIVMGQFFYYSRQDRKTKVAA